MKGEQEDKSEDRPIIYGYCQVRFMGGNILSHLYKYKPYKTETKVSPILDWLGVCSENVLLLSLVKVREDLMVSKISEMVFRIKVSVS